MTDFNPGQDLVKYNQPFFDEAEIQAVLEVLRKGWLVPGDASAAFEEKIGALFEKKYALFVNSGSSANLLVFKTLGFKPGSEVITPACTFSTTVSPILEAGLVPVFVDSDLGTYQANLEAIERAISKKTVALMIPHLIGNLNDMPALATLARRHKLVLVEDSCDTLGGKIHGKSTGHWSDLSTTSFYASHVITSGGAGGMFMTNDEDLFKRAEMMRSWGRAIPFYWEDIDRRFTAEVNGIPYDGKFMFSEIGYNFIPTEMQAAFGLAQLKKLDTYTQTRQKNFARLLEFFSNHQDFFQLPQALPNTETAWLAFPLTLTAQAPFDRKELMIFLEQHKIQTRPLFSGNLLLHPAYQNIPHRVSGALDNANTILERSFVVGLHQGMTPPMLDYMLEVFDTFLKQA